MSLVDTDVLVDVVRGLPAAVAWAESRGDDPLVMPGFVLLELIQGCRDRTAQKRVLDLAAKCRVVWLSEEAFGRAVDLFVQHRLGHGLDMIDVLVGQTALELGVPLMTFNTKHYSCVPGLEVVSPYDRG